MAPVGGRSQGHRGGQGMNWHMEECVGKTGPHSNWFGKQKRANFVTSCKELRGLKAWCFKGRQVG